MGGGNTDKGLIEDDTLPHTVKPNRSARKQETVSAASQDDEGRLGWWQVDQFTVQGHTSREFLLFVCGARKMHKIIVSQCVC